MTGSREVKTHTTAGNFPTLASLKSGLGLIDAAELNIAKTLGVTGVDVGGETNAQDGAVVSKDFLDLILGSVEGEVTDEEGVGGRAALVAELAGAVLLTIGTAGIVLASVGKVNVQLTAIELAALLGGMSLDGVSIVDELNITEALGAARVTVGDDADARDLAELLEFAGEPLLINVPGQVANEKVTSLASGSGSTLRDNRLELGLLGSGLLISLSLALLGLGDLLGIAIGGIGVGRVG